MHYTVTCSYGHCYYYACTVSSPGGGNYEPEAGRYGSLLVWDLDTSGICSSMVWFTEIHERPVLIDLF